MKNHNSKCKSYILLLLWLFVKVWNYSITFLFFLPREQAIQRASDRKNNGYAFFTEKKAAGFAL